MINELMLMPSFYFLLGSVIIFLLRATFVTLNLYKFFVIEGNDPKDKDVSMREIFIFVPVALTVLFSLGLVSNNMQDIYESDAKKVVEIITYYDEIAKNKQLGAELNQSAVYALIDIQGKLESNNRLNGYEFGQILERKEEFERKRVFLKENTSH